MLKNIFILVMFLSTASTIIGGGSTSRKGKVGQYYRMSNSDSTFSSDLSAPQPPVHTEEVAKPVSDQSAIQQLQRGVENSVASSTTNCSNQVSFVTKDEFFNGVITGKVTNEWWSSLSQVPQEWVNEAFLIFVMCMDTYPYGFNLGRFSDFFIRRADLHYKEDAAFVLLAYNYQSDTLKRLESRTHFRFSTYKRIWEYYQKVFNPAVNLGFPCTAKISVGQISYSMELFLRPISREIIEPYVQHSMIRDIPSTFSAQALQEALANVVKKIPAQCTGLLYGEIRDLILAELYPELADYYLADFNSSAQTSPVDDPIEYHI